MSGPSSTGLTGTLDEKSWRSRLARLRLEALSTARRMLRTKRLVLAGNSIASSGLRDRDIVLLTIQRQGVTTPNPRSGRELLAGDVLVCFGKIDTMRQLLPDTAGKVRRPRE